MDTAGICLGILFVLLLLWFIYRRHPSNLPPGPPTTIPILGHLQLFDGNHELHKQLSSWRAQYGDIFTVYLGSHPVVVLCSPSLIREALVTHADNFSDRPSWMFLIKMYFKSFGISWNQQSWLENRKFTKMAFRDLGLGKMSLEEQVMTESTALSQAIDDIIDRPFDPQTLLEPAVANVICSIVFGKRFDYDDEHFIDIFSRLSHNVKVNMIFSPPNYIPWCLPVYALIHKSRFRVSMDNMHRFKTFVKEHVDEHQQTFDSDNIRDFVDLYIQRERSGGVGKSSHDEEARVVGGMAMELFLAGTQSVIMTMMWFLVYMLHHPDIQTKCRREIHDVIGVGNVKNPPTMQDRASLPYTVATMMEVQRMSAVAAVTLPHCSKKDTTLRGYSIPKDTMILSSIYDAHHDVTTWGDPFTFRPERWLNEQGGVVTKHPAFMPFSLGSRTCLGDQLARMQIFIFGSSLLQHFRFLSADDVLPSLEGIQGVTMNTKPFRIIMQRTGSEND